MNTPLSVPLSASRRLQSYACGQWVHGTSDGKLLFDASNGLPVSTIDSTGLNFQDMLVYGRQRGGEKLRSMSFHQRALMLKHVGQALMADKELFYSLSSVTGATRTDSWIDIEGGISTLLSYGSKGRRELPNSRMLLDGPPEPLSADSTFSAQHILTPLQGVAVHINAFNFPCWGMLEKLAPTLLAGMPAIIKPASQTAYLTECMVRHIVATGILPTGALQLISGSVGDLLDHVTAQDVVTFTGSATTGQMLRAHPAIIHNSTRFTMEADSLNAAVLGLDATPDTPEFDLFIREVTREMITKAGQKCTAIRRVIVPGQHADAVVSALSARLADTPLGDPTDENVRMGPLVSLEQRQEVRECISELSAEAQIVFGDPDTPSLESGDADKGAFVNPVLLYCDQPEGKSAIHTVEAFGPVSTIIPYESTDDAVELAALGGGSLVASVFTNSDDFAHDLVEGLAPWHGRIMLGNRVSAKSSTGHGSPLPMLVHGGPGRAGGGEELGGIRAAKHYMQRSAIQGAPGLLKAVTGRWMKGAPANATEQHPFRKSLATLEVGDTVVSAARKITLDDIEHFAHFTGDTFYAHMDEEAAKANPFFDGRVAHGYLIVSFAAGLFVDPAPGPVLANYGVDNLRFMTPVYPNDSLQLSLTCKDINPRETDEHGEVRWDCTVTNQEAAVVAQYDVLTLVAKN